MYRHLLVPLDDTPLGRATVEQAVACARSLQARLTFLHARADAAASGEGALLHAMSPQDFGDLALGHSRSLLARAEASARAAGVPAASRSVTSDRPHEAILAEAGRSGCDLIFMASHGRRGLKGVLLGSVTRRVLEAAMLPVLVAAVESNQAEPSHEQRALALLREEHRSLAAVLHALEEAVVRRSGHNTPADVPLLRAMLFYIEQFPERLHHPKEEAWLFDRLRRRSPESADLLDELQAQHAAGAARFAQLRGLLEAGDASAFAQAVADFARQQWHHLGTEEQLVMPAASRHLLPQDWQAIAGAFETNQDLRLGSSESFDSLASRLLALAASNPTTRT